MGNLTENFSKEEFSCPCCDAECISLEFVATLQTVRTRLGLPIRPTSAYRCQHHNKAVGGVEDSAHTKGLASDIHIPDSTLRYLYMREFMKVFSRIGMGVGFIHVDIDPDKPQNLIWMYPQNRS